MKEFDTDDEELLIKAAFVNKNSFPTISIEANLRESSLQPISWTLGPSYVYSGLLSIYLLAKENNLFFYIRKKNQKLILTLEPLNKQGRNGDGLLNVI